MLELRVLLKQQLKRGRITPSRKHNGFFCSFFFFAFHKDIILFISCFVLVGDYCTNFSLLCWNNAAVFSVTNANKTFV